MAMPVHSGDRLLEAQLAVIDADWAALRIQTEELYVMSQIGKTIKKVTIKPETTPVSPKSTPAPKPVEEPVETPV